ncbi:MAG: ferrous iron transport protein B [Clostridiales bacterium]|nr:ferrous iron transport protein B [Clostridiales bacterium]
MSIKIALAGNPNSGKTTLFNALTGSNQFVGNWPGVTVEKKEGKLKFRKEVAIMDLPGIYSLSPYTLEEVVARNYLINEKPDAILNIVDGSNLERNLYLTTQLMELGIPVVVAINMMDVVKKAGDKIDTKGLPKLLGCPVVEISALKGTGVKEAAETAVKAAEAKKVSLLHPFGSETEHAIAHIEDLLKGKIDKSQERWFAIKVFEGDKKVLEDLKLDSSVKAEIKTVVGGVEKEFDDDGESIITNERYVYIASILKGIYKKQKKGELTVSDKIDKIVTNRILALPIFAIVMIIVYYISVTTVGGIATDWANDGLFGFDGDGWHLFGIGTSAYEEAAGDFDTAQAEIEAFVEAAEEAGIDTEEFGATLEEEEADEAVIADFIEASDDVSAVAEIENEDGEIEETIDVDIAEFEAALAAEEPDPADFGIFIPGIGTIAGNILEGISCPEWLSSLILDGIIAGVGAVLGFVPQMLILFIFLAFLESCGYMARVAFIMDRIFRKFGLSGKSFIPMLIGTGCGVPGVMASRTIESDRDRKMTIITTTFIPCGAKLPIIALIAGALFDGAWWVAPSSYFIGVAAIIISGIILKKTQMFAGDPAPFVMELPAYHWPTVGNVLRSTWERGWSFIKKAGTIILLATILIWFLSGYDFGENGFGAVDMNESLLATIGNCVAFIFKPLGFGDWRSAVAAVSGLIAKENVVGTFGVLYRPELAEVAEDGAEIWANLQANFGEMSGGHAALAGYSYLVFNLLCAPCFAAMGAIKREMNSAKWTVFAIGYQCVFAYLAALVIYQVGLLLSGDVNIIGLIAALVVIALALYLLFRPQKNLTSDAKASVSA